MTEIQEPFGKWEPVPGKVVAEVCPLCGHHEIGIVGPDGMFFPLRPGDTVTLEKTKGGVAKRRLRV